MVAAHGEAKADLRFGGYQIRSRICRDISITLSAYRDATQLGFDRAAIVEVIQAIEPRMFVKSMTTHADHRVWQDVYNVPAADIVLCVKFQASVITEFTVMAFKER